ncbi:hypothetical protein G6M89_20920 [Natronolimnobius sp. AArcel1]|uniref:S24/S26 family peptidase n=1 Tax=Natronolimnobius sp. AArcel1 TaxID=1679093 RepID=UPI0013EB1DC5|nr:S24/S26 family peptidase [Natronolimnobius sp. AArcel1]NGM71424.1 hypothetical protein [Natronolimnobius sp. AArcel1]
MDDRRIYAVGLLASLLAAAWILAGPVLGLPFGIVASDGPSMGDDGMMVNVWVDSEPEVGDVVIFEQDGQLTDDRPVHRVADETGSGYVTQGDANPYTDQEVTGVDYVTDENRVGVVVARTPVSTLTLGLFFTIIGISLYSKEKELYYF